MLCAIYKSNIKASAYLYVRQKNEFGSVPDALMEKFGKPIFVMLLDLSKKEKLAAANIEKVRESLHVDGYYLQLPPPLDATLSHIRSQNNKLI